jgi:hypothetical protein
MSSGKEDERLEQNRQETARQINDQQHVIEESRRFADSLTQQRANDPRNVIDDGRRFADSLSEESQGSMQTPTVPPSSTGPTDSNPSLSVWDGVERQGTAMEKTRGMPVGKPEEHHVFPQKFKEYFTNEAMGRKIDIDKYVLPIDREVHKITHGKGGFFDDFNAQWADWITKNPNATEQQVFEQAGKMMDHFGLSLGKIKNYSRRK